jgi:hypothetical protein
LPFVINVPVVVAAGIVTVTVYEPVAPGDNEPSVHVTVPVEPTVGAVHDAPVVDL